MLTLFCLISGRVNNRWQKTELWKGLCYIRNIQERHKHICLHNWHWWYSSSRKILVWDNVKFCRRFMHCYHLCSSLQASSCSESWWELYHQIKQGRACTWIPEWFRTFYCGKLPENNLCYCTCMWSCAHFWCGLIIHVCLDHPFLPDSAQHAWETNPLDQTSGCYLEWSKCT